MKSIPCRLLLLLFLIAPALQISAVETAAQILERCARKVNESPSVTLNFTLAYANSKSDCRLVISRQKFCLTSSELEVWYDGVTQWAYSASENEVSITDPTPEEQLETNPFAILNHFSDAYTVRRLSGNSLDVELVAKNRHASIRKAVLTVNSRTYLPEKLIVTMNNGRTFSATVTSASVGKNLPASTFVFNKTLHPSVVIVDLR